MTTTKTIEERLMEEAAYHPWLEGEPIYPDVMVQLLHTAESAWDGPGWYQVGTGRTTWDVPECYDLGTAIGLAVQMYADYVTSSCCALRNVWAARITDPEVIADLEGEWE